MCGRRRTAATWAGNIIQLSERKTEIHILICLNVTIFSAARRGEVALQQKKEERSSATFLTWRKENRNIEAKGTQQTNFSDRSIGLSLNVLNCLLTEEDAKEIKRRDDI